MSGDLALLLDAAREAAALATELRAKGLEVHHKAGGSPVTNGDLAVDALLKARLLAARPGYGWLSEETADDPDRLTKARIFLVDPIDGTTAYVKGRDWWTVCVAVVENGRPSAGVVIAPSLDQVYAAEAGRGATRNGAAIRAGGCNAIEGCSMLGDAKLFADPRWPRPWPDMRIAARNSIALRMCLVAAGEFDAVMAPGPKHDWDLAAADLIATEAGAVVTDNAGRVYAYNRQSPAQKGLVCANPRLHPLLIERLAHIEAP